MNPTDMYDLITEALEVEPGTINADTKIADVDEWNSIGWLTLMSLLDERVNVQLNSKDVRGFKTAGEVVDHVVQRAATV